jgi:hypothetical protein
VLTAIARRRPPLACGSTDGAVPNVSCVSPAITAWIAGAPPRYGTVRHLRVGQQVEERRAEVRRRPVARR